MSIDVNGIFGHWPVRTPGIWEPSEFLRRMDQLGIERALLTASVALLDNTAAGNDQVAHVVGAFSDRFLGACVVNPHPDPQAAAVEARRRFEQGFRALRLFPAHHGYTTAEEGVLEPAMGEARSAEAPVILTLRVSGDTGFAETPVSAARAFAASFPDVPTIVSGAGYADRIALTRVARAHPNIHVEISHMHGADAVRVLTEALGSARVLFGTGMGVLYASPAVRKVAAAGLADGDREAVLSGNARRLLGLT
ncbi:MAG: amidohydrolase family protein [Armatimonadetes bacterium]|nr:amidohydrolase family protein [Armatimonadota bacterium]